MVFVDQPAGIGLSVATSDAGYANNQSDIGARFVEFLQNFYAKYPVLRAKQLWLTGESCKTFSVPPLAAVVQRAIPPSSLMLTPSTAARSPTSSLP